MAVLPFVNAANNTTADLAFALECADFARAAGEFARSRREESAIRPPATLDSALKQKPRLNYAHWCAQIARDRRMNAEKRRNGPPGWG
jgi:hypothetical protein